LTNISEALRVYAPDVINIHNIHGAWWAGVTGELLSLCGRIAPVVWTLHDMWTFTGCCTYSLDCSAFTKACTIDCPVADNYFPFSAKRVPLEWDKKSQALLANPEAVAVSPSGWLAQQARQGLWRNNRVEALANGIDTTIYRPRDMVELRGHFGLRDDLPMILTSYNPVPSYKGANTVLQLLEIFKDRPWQWVIIGAESPAGISSLRNVQSFGYVRSEEEKARLFACADVYVHASLAENLPNIIIECMMCGTPTVAFDIGGVPELVRPGVTGWLARNRTTEELGSELLGALTGSKYSELRLSCRAVALKEYSLLIQANKYLRLFEELAQRRVRL
jgi:glycosyltransferase involved in cell wall biosynthesis